MINPETDDDDVVDVSCDIQVVRPDNSYSINASDVACMKGVLLGDPRSIRLSAPIIRFVGEAGDLPGNWVVNVKLNDRNRGVVIPLKTGFELVQ